MEGLHRGLGDAIDAQDRAFGEGVCGEGCWATATALSQVEADVLGGELDVGAAGEDMIDVEILRGAVEVEGDEAGGVGRVAVAAFKGAVLEDGDDCDGGGGGDEGAGLRKWLASTGLRILVGLRLRLK